MAANITKREKEELDELIVLYQKYNVLVLQSILDHKVVNVSINRILGKYSVPFLTTDEMKSELIVTVWKACENYSKKEEINKFYTYLYKALYFATCTMLKKYEFTKRKEFMKENGIEIFDIDDQAYDYLTDSKPNESSYISYDKEYKELEKLIRKLNPNVKKKITDLYLTYTIHNTSMATCAEYSGISRNTLNPIFRKIKARLQEYYSERR